MSGNAVTLSVAKCLANRKKLTHSSRKATATDTARDEPCQRRRRVAICGCISSVCPAASRPGRAFAVNDDVPMGVPVVVDLAHEAVSIPAERWQRWHEIARAI